jgi:hypothetical protein
MNCGARRTVFHVRLDNPGRIGAVAVATHSESDPAGIADTLSITYNVRNVCLARRGRYLRMLQKLGQDKGRVPHNRASHSGLHLYHQHIEGEKRGYCNIDSRRVTTSCEVASLHRLSKGGQLSKCTQF